MAENFPEYGSQRKTDTKMVIEKANQRRRTRLTVEQTRKRRCS